MKQCARCGQDKPLSDFGTGKKWADGHFPYCKPCRAEYSRQWRRDNPARQRAILNRSAERQREQRERLGLTYSDVSRMKRYGMSLDQYEETLERQAGVCAVCGGPPVHRTNATLKFDVDHCHESGRWRGLLCGPCNRGLGLFHDDPARLRAAAAYLERFAAASGTAPAS